MSESDFTWRTFIEIDHNALGAYASEVEGALDKIAQTPEGRALIENAPKAFKNSKTRLQLQSESDKVVISDRISRSMKAMPGNGFGGAAQPDYGNIAIDMERLYRLRYNTEDGSSERLDTLGILVHELYHLNDPNLDIVGDSKSTLSFVIKALKTDIAKAEKQAVEYTDAFMAKYFSYPPRKTYGNQFLSNVIDDRPLPEFSCSASNLPTYIPEQGQPEISPTPCVDVIHKLPQSNAR